MEGALSTHIVKKLIEDKKRKIREAAEEQLCVNTRDIGGAAMEYKKGLDGEPSKLGCQHNVLVEPSLVADRPTVETTAQPKDKTVVRRITPTVVEARVAMPQLERKIARSAYTAFSVRVVP